jgi:hypothetical protein
MIRACYRNFQVCCAAIPAKGFPGLVTAQAVLLEPLSRPVAGFVNSRCNSGSRLTCWFPAVGFLNFEEE